jgi:hypothetical protein
MTKATIFEGGIPTAPDVAKLVTSFGAPDRGRLITYEEIEKVIEVGPTTCRFRTVTNAWRNHLRDEHGLVTVAEPGVGFRVLLDAELIGHSIGRRKKGIREIGRAGRDLAQARDEGLDEVSKASRDHVGRQIAQEWHALQDASRKLKVTLMSQPQLPRTSEGTK